MVGKDRQKYKEARKVPGIEDLVDFVGDVVEERTDPVFGKLRFANRKNKLTRIPGKGTGGGLHKSRKPPL